MAVEILTHITEQFQQATRSWHAYLFPIANHLFATLASIEIAWAGIWWAVEKNDMSSLWGELLKKIMSLGIFYTILLNSNSWIPAIINGFMQIGEGASGQANLYPSDVLAQGISISTHIFNTFHNVGMFSWGLPTLVGAIAGFFVLIAFAVIAGLLVVSLVESYIVIGAGVLMLGFASSRLTSKFATNYLSYAMSVGAKLFMLYLILGIGGNLATSWISLFENMPTVSVAPFLEIMGGALVYVFIAWAIPAKAESLISGASNATLGGFVAAAATIGATAATGAMGARVVMGAGSGALETLKQAHTIGQSMGGGALATAAGVVGAGANLGLSAAGSLVGHHASTAGSMANKTNGIKQFYHERSENKASSASVVPPTPVTNPAVPTTNPDNQLK